MKTESTVMTTTVIYSDDGQRRYSLKKVWDDKLNKLAVIMLAPATASGIAVDHTTMYILDNAVRLGFGSVEIVNLNSMIGDSSFRSMTEDPENIAAIIAAAKEANTVVYAPGSGMNGNKVFLDAQKEILNLIVAEGQASKLMCLSDGVGGRFYHPLAPKVRLWELEAFTVNEVTGVTDSAAQKRAKAGKSGRKNRKEVDVNVEKADSGPNAGDGKSSTGT